DELLECRLCGEPVLAAAEAATFARRGDSLHQWVTGGRSVPPVSAPPRSAAVPPGLAHARTGRGGGDSPPLPSARAAHRYLAAGGSPRAAHPGICCEAPSRACPSPVSASRLTPLQGSHTASTGSRIRSTTTRSLRLVSGRSA